MILVQEVEHSVQISVGKPGKHMVLQCVQSRAWDWMATSSHANLVEVMMIPMIMVQNAAIGMPRMGVG